MADDNNTFDWQQPLASGAIAATQAITKGGPRRQFKWAKRYAKFENKMNRANAEWTLEQNRILQAEQRAWDSPAAQMARYEAAGLNKNLIYDHQTNSPMLSVGSLPGASARPSDTSYPDIAGQFQNAQLMQSQLGLTNQKISESETKQDVMKAQEQLIQANPYMRPSYVDSIVKNMEAIAALKDQEKQFNLSRTTGAATAEQDDTKWQRGYLKMQRELDLLGQKFNLNTADQKMKATIIEGKGFENALKEIEKNWLSEGDITPEHIRQGIMMLLMKLR